MTSSSPLFLALVVPALLLPASLASGKEAHWICHDPIKQHLADLNRLIENYDDRDPDAQSSPTPMPPAEQVLVPPAVRLMHNFTATPGAAAVTFHETHHPATFTVQGRYRLWNFGPAHYHYFLIAPDGRGSYYDLTAYAAPPGAEIARLREASPTHNYTCHKELR